ncbi:MAG TPA: hypothetical protein VN578_15465 [Candidatus Binatia bacterium]|nr:hypothetical protein [Candidatus Binatia bacterium]
MPLTVRRCPERVHRALKKHARENRRSLNNEALFWLERQADETSEAKPMPALEAAKRLRAWSRKLTRKEHHELAESIERGVVLMRHEHLPNCCQRARRWR